MLLNNFFVVLIIEIMPKCLICGIFLQQKDSKSIQLPQHAGIQYLWCKALQIPAGSFDNCVRKSYICAHHFHPDELFYDENGKLKGFVKGKAPHRPENGTELHIITVIFFP